jgi:hypothetical protein
MAETLCLVSFLPAYGPDFYKKERIIRLDAGIPGGIKVVLCNDEPIRYIHKPFKHAHDESNRD